MTTIAKLSADLDVKTSRFEAGMARARARAKETQGVLDRFNVIGRKGFGAVGTGIDGVVGKFNALKAGIATLIGAAGLTALIKHNVNAASAIKDMSERLQISTDALQKFQFAAALGGTGTETLEAAITKLNAKIADGSHEYKNAEEGLFSIADAFKAAKTDAERTAIVNDEFGAKLGNKMIPLLKDGAEGLRAMGIEAERVGAVLSSSTIDAADKLGDTLDTLAKVIEKSFAQGFLDKLVDGSDDLRNIYNDPQFAKNIQAIGGLFGSLAEQALKLVSIIGELITKFNELENLSKGSYGLDEKFMDWGSRTFDTPENQQKRKMQKLGFGGNALGGNVQRMARMGAGLMTPTMPETKFNFEPPNVTPYKPPQKPKPPKPPKTPKEEQDRVKIVLDGLKKETDLLAIQNGMYGQKASVIERALRQSEIQNTLAAQGIVLTKDQQAQITKYLDLLAQQQQLQEDQQKYNETMQEFSDVIRSSFESAIESGDSLSDVLTGLLKDIEKLIIKKTLLDPLFGDGSQGSTGILGGILEGIGGAIFGSAPSHATGQQRVPYDMFARLHKNEAVIPAQQANKMSGGSDVHVNVMNMNGSSVKVEQKTGDNGTDIEVMVDNAVAKNIGKHGSKTQQALGAQGNKTLVRR